jgi:hypothetical protein
MFLRHQRFKKRAKMPVPKLEYEVPEPADDPTIQWQRKKLKTLGIAAAGVAAVYIISGLFFGSYMWSAHHAPQTPPTPTTAAAH